MRSVVRLSLPIPVTVVIAAVVSALCLLFLNRLPSVGSHQTVTELTAENELLRKQVETANTQLAEQMAVWAILLASLSFCGSLCLPLCVCPHFPSYLDRQCFPLHSSPVATHFL